MTVVYVLLDELHHENVVLCGVYSTLELAQKAYGQVGPCECQTSRHVPGWVKQPTGWYATTCSTDGITGEIQVCKIDDPRAVVL